VANDVRLGTAVSIVNDCNNRLYRDFFRQSEIGSFEWRGVAWRRGFSLVLMVNTLGLNGDLYMNLEKRLLSVNEVASSLGIGPTTVRYHLQARHWPGVRFGKRGVWRIPAEVLFALQNGIDPKRLRKDAESMLGLDSR